MTHEPPNEPQTAEDEAALPVDPIDERLSAALDDATAGSPVLDASSADRLRALEAARDLLAIAPPPLDDLTRRRLLRTAVAASPARARDLRLVRGVGVAAALVAVVVLGGWALTSLGHDSNFQKASSGAAATATTGVVAPVDLREVSDPLVLKRRVKAVLNGAQTNVKPEHNDSKSPSVAPSPQQERCLSTLTLVPGATSRVLGTATFHGAPALVIVAADHSRTLIYVLASTDCRLLSSQFLRE